MYGTYIGYLNTKNIFFSFKNWYKEKKQIGIKMFLI